MKLFLLAKYNVVCTCLPWYRSNDTPRALCTRLTENYLHGVETLLRSRQKLNWSRNPPPFLQPKYSLSYLQDPITGPYPESDESSLHIHPLFLWDSFQHYLPTYFYVSQLVCSLQVFQLKFICLSYWFHAFYMSRSYHPRWFEHPNNMWLRIEIIKLLCVYSSPSPTLTAP
jgi:hypothetical protein